MKQPKKSSQKSKNSSILCNFVHKLYNILQDQNNKYTIKWTQNGQGFQFIDQESFINLTLKKYYRHSNLASFIRQLNMYGFRKIKQNDGRSYYTNPLFLKDQPHLIKQISRKAQKKLLGSRFNSKLNCQNQLNIQQTNKFTSKYVNFDFILKNPPIKNQSICSLVNFIGNSCAQIFHNENIYLNTNNNSRRSIKQQLRLTDKISIDQNIQISQNQLSSQFMQNQSQYNKQILLNKSIKFSNNIKSSIIFWTPSDII